jgi:hypothetical protein
MAAPKSIPIGKRPAGTYELQLIAFLNAVLKRIGKDRIEPVEILEDKDLPTETVGGKAGRLDVLARQGLFRRVPCKH